MCGLFCIVKLRWSESHLLRTLCCLQWKLLNLTVKNIERWIWDSEIFTDVPLLHLEMETPRLYCTGWLLEGIVLHFRYAISLVCVETTPALKVPQGGTFSLALASICTLFFSSCIEILNRWSLMLTMVIKGSWITSHSAFFFPIVYIIQFQLASKLWKSFCRVFKLEQVNVNSLKRGKSSPENRSCLSLLLWAKVNIKPILLRFYFFPKQPRIVSWEWFLGNLMQGWNRENPFSASVSGNKGYLPLPLTSICTCAAWIKVRRQLGIKTLIVLDLEAAKILLVWYKYWYTSTFFDILSEKQIHLALQIDSPANVTS